MKTSAELVLERQTELPAYVVPQWTKLLTAGVDVQENSLYWSIRAFGEFLTSQNIAHGQSLSFEEIDRIMNMQYMTEEGDPMVVNLCLIDSGDQTDIVYDFCALHSDYALPVKGSSHAQLSHYKLSMVNKTDSRAYGMQLVLVDGGRYKDMIAGRMQRPNGKGSWMVYSGCDMEYATQVTAEHKVNVKTPGGTKQVWQKKSSHADNHYLDTEVYALAAADVMGVRTLHLVEEQQVNPAREEPETPEEQWIKANENWI